VPKSLRNLIGGLGLVVILIAVVAFVAQLRSNEPIDCDVLETEEVERSQRLLASDLRASIVLASSELVGVEADLDTTEQELKATETTLEGRQDDLKTMEEALSEKEAERDAAQADPSSSGAALGQAETDDDETVGADSTNEIASERERNDEIGALNEAIGALIEEIGALKEEIASVTETKRSLDEAIDALNQSRAAVEARLRAKNLALGAILYEKQNEAVLARSELKSKKAELAKAERGEDGKQITELSNDIASLEEEVVSLADPFWSGEQSLSQDAGHYLPPRSNANLVPKTAVARIDLGSVRHPGRVEIVFDNANAVAADASTVSAAGGETDVTSLELPDKATYFTEAGQFRRSTGPEISSDKIQVWTRRMGTFAVMSVCITPGGLDAGMYEGDVYVIDPSMSPSRVHVELAAQAEYMNLVYALLVISPIVALVYVWAKSRHSAGVYPWDKRAFVRWVRLNGMLAIVVGFIAVWATLQVPFNNPTWGSSLLNAAAVIGVGLVAAVIAITAVAGTVRGEGIDEISEVTEDG
jgi:prefoldin subunit 5